MNENIRIRRKVFGVISRSRLLFAFAGSFIIVFAFFVPTIQQENFYPWGPVTERTALWIFGFTKYIFYPSTHPSGGWEWFGRHDTDKLNLAVISIGSTVALGALVLGTLLASSITIIRKRRKEIYSSRLVLLFSIGIFMGIHSYFFALRVLSVVSFYSLLEYWGASDYFFNTMGINLFILGSILILLGYTVKIKPLLKIISLYIAFNLLFQGVSYLMFFYNNLVYPSENARNFTIGIINLGFSLAIVVTNLVIFLRIKKKGKSLKKNEEVN